MSKKNFKPLSFHQQCDAIIAHMEAEEKAAREAAEKARLERYAASAKACRLFDEICDKVSRAVEQLQNGQDISDDLIVFVNRFEIATETQLSDELEPKDITRLTRLFLQKIGQ